MFAPRGHLTQRLLSGIDLMIDFATLGEYGLEPLPAAGPCSERSGGTSGWEALGRGRRGGCGQVADSRQVA